MTTPAQLFLTKESRYGDDGKERNSYYDGVNVNVNARMSNGLFVSLGTQTGRRVDDRCNVVQNFYLREVRNGRNEFVSIAHPDLADPARRRRDQVRQGRLAAMQQGVEIDRHRPPPQRLADLGAVAGHHVEHARRQVPRADGRQLQDRQRGVLGRRGPGARGRRCRRQCP